MIRKDINRYAYKRLKKLSMLGKTKAEGYCTKDCKYCVKSRKGFKPTCTVPECPVCHELITIEDYKDTEYIKLKSGVDRFIHTKCVKNIWR